MARSRLSVSLSAVFLFIVLHSVAHAAVEEIWQFYVTILPGQTFDSLGKAEAAMRASSIDASNLTVKDEYISDIQITKYYHVEPVNPTFGPWQYTGDSWQCFSSEGEALNSIVDTLQASNKWCSVTWSPSGNFSGGGGGSTLCGIPYGGYESEARPYTQELYSPYIGTNGEELCAGPYYNDWAPRIIRVRPRYCPDGYYFYYPNCINSIRATIYGSLNQTCTITEGNPCSPATGEKTQTEIDFQAPGLEFKRSYHSYTQTASNSYLGNNWYHNYTTRLILTYGFPAGAVRQNGNIEPIKARNYTTNYIAYSGAGITVDPDGTGWLLRTKSGDSEYYDNTGKLIRTVDNAGAETSYDYDPGTGKLLTVSDAMGHSLAFTYAADTGLLDTVTDQSNRIVSYLYSVTGNLDQVTNPDNTTRQYHYEDPRHPTHLTGITDERGMRYAYYGYDDKGRAILTEHAGGVGRKTFAYNADGSTTVTNSLGINKIYTFNINGPGIRRPSNISEAGASVNYVYRKDTDWTNPQTRLYSKTDENGVITTYTYDTHNRTSQTEAAGTPQARTTSYTYDPSFYSKVATQTEPSVYAAGNKVTTYGYDDLGNTTSIKIDGFTPDGTPVSRTTKMQYLGPLNQLSQINGPRTDVNDVTTLAYYANDPIEGNNRGRLKSVTGPTSILMRSNIQYSATGKVLSETRPNGLTITNTYYPGNDRLETTTQTAGSETRTTRWTYLPTGEVETITQAYGTVDATTLTFGYDDARRMTRITDGLGNYIEYTLDTEGNKTAENHYDNLGSLKKALSQTFDLYNRLNTTAQANEATDYDFAADGTLAKQTDGKGAVTDYGYDVLKRLTTTTQDLGGTNTSTADTLTRYGYDVHNNLTQVTDPNNNASSYVYDDLGNLLSQTSPDTGTTAFTYDDAGNINTKTDAKGQILTYSYDAANRLLTIDAPGTDEDVSYGYDACANGNGKLCTATMGGISVNYTYTPFGDIAAHQGVSYSYNPAGRLTTMTYPSGVMVSYNYNAAGQVRQIDLDDGTSTQTLVRDVSYTAFGPVNSFSFGNGAAAQLTYDTAYRHSHQTTGTILDWDYTSYDANGNLTGLTDSLTSNIRSFGYDALNRLEAANDSLFNQSYGYDKNGNRLQLTDNGIATDSLYEPSSNRLSQVGAASYIRDANGNTTNDGLRSYAYNHHNRLVSIDSGSAAYQYNALGQRVNKTVNTTATSFAYDLNGQLLGEYDTNGNAIQEFIYLNGQPIAVIDVMQVETTPEEPVDIIVDNLFAGASWLGNWTLSANNPGHHGSNYRYVYPADGTSVFTWQTPLEPGQYEVYGWWAATTISSTAATYRVDHANGSDQIVVDQQVNGGQWNLLGTYTFDTLGQVALLEPTDAPIIADAVRFVRKFNNPVTGVVVDTLDAGASWIGNWVLSVYRPGYYNSSYRYIYPADGTGAFTWQTSLEPGQYNVYGWWAATTISSTAATYQVDHATGSDQIVVNQQTNGAQWNLLGTYTFDTQGQVSLLEPVNAPIIADAVYFMKTSPATVAQRKVYYIHTDHLGTPRKVSDPATNAVVWNWDSDPFGTTAANDDPDGDGNQFVLNLRFPGQYYDSESGLHYNYFRYYDPKTGRYLTSDPIGLEGGLNTYAYVSNNPINFFDPDGLSQRPGKPPMGDIGDAIDHGKCGWWPAACIFKCIRWRCEREDECGNITYYFIGHRYPYASRPGYNPNNDDKCVCVLKGLVPGNM